MYLPGLHVMCSSCWAPYSLLNHVEKRLLSWLSSYAGSDKMVKPVTTASCFNHRPIICETGKKGQQFTLLRRITNYKSVNSESIEGSILSQRVPSWGSCHLVDSTWVTHLNWNNFSNFVVECIGRDIDPKNKNLTRREFIGRRELATDAQYSCGRCSCPL